MEAVRLRPHHVLDIVRDFRPDRGDYAPAPGENGVRTVVRMMTQGIDFPAEFVAGPDVICAPCSHLQPNGRCDRVLDQHDPPERMDDYNDPLDARILAYLALEPGTVMTVRAFLETVNSHLPGIEEVCTHPTEERADRREGLAGGLVALGVRARRPGDAGGTD
jgi:hypothetical protein